MRYSILQSDSSDIDSDDDQISTGNNNNGSQDNIQSGQGEDQDEDEDEDEDEDDDFILEDDDEDEEKGENISLRDYGYSVHKTERGRIGALKRAVSEEGLDLVCARLEHLGKYHPVMLEDLETLKPADAEHKC